MKHIETFSNDHRTATVYRNVEWDEYVVKQYNDGVYLGPDASYHTQDKQDAIGTARFCVGLTN